MKKLFPILLAAAMAAASLAGCSASRTGSQKSQAEETEPPDQAIQSSEAQADREEDGKAPVSESGKAESESETGASGQTEERTGDAAGPDGSDQDVIRVGALKGPTSMGLVSLIYSDASANRYEFNMVTAADELAAAVASERTDIALVPANLASVLYNKTKGGISVIDINTLGVLYVVSSDPSIQSVADLKGKTVYLTGKGTTPDYVARYLIRANGLSETDVTLEYKSESAEIAAILEEKDGAVGLLPQPFVTVACARNEALKAVLDLTAEWDQLQGQKGSRLVTGVTIVRNDFLKEHENEVKVFLSDHRVSAEAAARTPDEIAELIVRVGILEQESIARQALPFCNITYIDGEEMKTALSGYLNVLFGQDPQSVGGALPGDDFYYMAGSGVTAQLP